MCTSCLGFVIMFFSVIANGKLSNARSNAFHAARHVHNFAPRETTPIFGQTSRRELQNDATTAFPDTSDPNFSWSDPEWVELFYEYLFSNPNALNRTNITFGVRLIELTSLYENDATFDAQFEIDVTYPEWLTHSNYSDITTPQYADVVPFLVGDRATALADAFAQQLFAYTVDGYWTGKYLVNIRYSYAFDFSQFFLDSHTLPCGFVCLADMYVFQCNWDLRVAETFNPAPRGWNIDSLSPMEHGWILSLVGMEYPYNQYYFPIGGIDINISRVSGPMFLRLAFPLWVIMIILFTTRAFGDPAERLGHVITILLVLVAYNLSTLTLIPKGNTTTRVDSHTMISYASVFLVFTFNFTIVLVQLKLDKWEEKRKKDIRVRRMTILTKDDRGGSLPAYSHSGDIQTNAEVEMLDIPRNSADLHEIWDEKVGKKRSPRSASANLELPKVKFPDKMELTQEEEQEIINERPWWIKAVFEYEDEVYIVLFLASFISQIVVYV